jgi:acetyl-CoA acetyltransferase
VSASPALALRDRTAIAGVGCSRFGRNLPESQLQLAAAAFKAALADSGLQRDQVDGLSVNLGWPLGLDYDRIAEAFGLDIRYVNQTWTHGRFVTMSLQQAAMAVAAGLADVVACVAVASFTRERDILGGPGDLEGMREDGGTHAENPPYGLTAPAAGAALAYRRYMHLYDADTEALGEVAVTLRGHARKNPGAVMRAPMTLADHQASRDIVAPLRLYDCCIVSDGAVVLLVTSAERARDLAKPPVLVSGMQGIRSGRDEFIFAPPGLGINQQRPGRVTPRPGDDQSLRMAGIGRGDIDGLYTYDAFTPLPLFVLERYGFCGPGEAHQWVRGGRIALGGELPLNSNGGLHSEAHVSGWNHLAEMVRQLRGEAGERQISGATHLQWATLWGDSVVLRRDA